MNPRFRVNREGRGFTFHISEGSLILTVAPRDVMLCRECEDYHIYLCEATRENLLLVGGGIVHLADHLGKAAQKK